MSLTRYHSSVNRRRVIVLGLITALATACRTTSGERQVAVRLDALFTDLHQRSLFDGAAVIANQRGVIWAEGFGFANAERRIRFTPDTPTDGASLAKTFTATVVLMLADEHRLDLDAPVRTLLPELPYADITLRHLLSHTSGLPVLDYDYFDRFLPADQVRTTEVLLGVLSAQRPALASAPGAAFEYSSFGYDLAALAASRAAGKSFSALLQERIFRPLEITSAFVRPGRFSDFPGVRTLGYRHSGTSLEPNDVFDFEAFHGGSNVYISATDLHRWNASFLDKSLLGAKALQNALRFADVAAHQSALTLGNWYRSGAAFWYSGHLQGFHSEVFRDTARGWSIVYTSNNTIEPWLQKGLVRAVTAILAGHDAPPMVAPDTDEVPKDQRSSLAGTWLMHDGTRRTIDRSSGYLRLMQDGVGYRVVQVSPRWFYAPGIDFMIGFSRGANGSFERILVSSNVDEQWGTRDAS